MSSDHVNSFNMLLSVIGNVRSGSRHTNPMGFMVYADIEMEKQISTLFLTKEVKEYYKSLNQMVGKTRGLTLATVFDLLENLLLQEKIRCAANPKGWRPLALEKPQQTAFPFESIYPSLHRVAKAAKATKEKLKWNGVLEDQWIEAQKLHTQASDKKKELKLQTKSAIAIDGLEIVLDLGDDEKIGQLFASSRSAYQKLTYQVEELIKNKENAEFDNAGDFFFHLGQVYAKCAMLAKGDGEHQFAVQCAYEAFNRAYESGHQVEMRAELFTHFYELQYDATPYLGLWGAVNSRMMSCLQSWKDVKFT